MKTIKQVLFWTSSKSMLCEFPNRPIYLVIDDKTVYPYISHINFIIGSTRNFYKL